jgi:nucleotide-binding universal stress UspA family protein
MSTPAPILAAFSPHTDERGPVEFAIAAARMIGAPLVVVAVHPEAHERRIGGGDHDPSDSEAGSIDALKKELAERKVDADVRVYGDSSIARGLKQAIEDVKPELAVLGATDKGRTSSKLLGSTAEKVIHEATCPVAVVPHGYVRPDGGVQKIVAAFSPSPEGYEALQAGVALARAGGAKLRAITAHEKETGETSSEGMLAHEQHDADSRSALAARHRLDAESVLREAVAETAGGLEVETDVFGEDPAEALVGVSRHTDLIIMGSRARAPRRAVLLGSVSRKVTERAECPVVVLPRGADEMSKRLIAAVEARQS